MGKSSENYQQHGENNEFFRANRSFFGSESAIRSQKTSESLMSRGVKERLWANPFRHSFVKSDESESLTVAL